MVVDKFDTANITNGEPSEITKSELLRWRRTELSDTYDPTLYDLEYHSRSAGGTNTFTITATSDATGFYVDEALADTDAYPVGHYYWTAFIVRKADSERVRVGSGQWDVMANLEESDADPRSHAKKMIDLLQDVLEGRAENDVIYYMIGGRAISKIPLDDLRKLLQDYKAEYSQELIEESRTAGKSNRNKMQVRFT